MSDVSFNEEQSFTPATPAAAEPKGKGIAGLFQKLTGSKDAKQTNTIMISVIVICVVIMLLVWLT